MEINRGMAIIPGAYNRYTQKVAMNIELPKEYVKDKVNVVNVVNILNNFMSAFFAATFDTELHYFEETEKENPIKNVLDLPQSKDELEKIFYHTQVDQKFKAT